MRETNVRDIIRATAILIIFTAIVFIGVAVILEILYLADTILHNYINPVDIKDNLYLIRVNFIGLLIGLGIKVAEAKTRKKDF